MRAGSGAASRSAGMLLPRLGAAPVFLQGLLTRFVIPPAVHQAAEKRLEGRGQTGNRTVLGVNVDDARLALRPAATVVEHDRVVPGRRGPADNDSDVRQSGL